MLSALASIPSGVGSFISNRRKTFTWVAGTVGGAYVLGQWGMKRIGEMAERSARENADKDNLARRFNLNQDDCQFTVLALLPTLSTQLMQSMDVEACSAELANVAAKAKAREREQSAEAEREKLRQEQEQEQEAQRVQQEGVLVIKEESPEPPLLSNGAQVDAVAETTPPSVDLSQVELSPSAIAGTHGGPAPPPRSPLLSSSKLSAAAPAFSPGKPLIPPPIAPDPPSPPPAAAEPPLSSDSTILSKSWAEVVATSDEQAEEVKHEPQDGDAAQASLPAEPEVPERSRAEIWDDIKILSFTRTITSLYIITLLTLQTHVQLNLLGRASYVSSVISTLPSNGSTESLKDKVMDYDEDLELALYGAKKQKDEAQVGVSKETERKYLTFSWWLLHQGWKTIAGRVRSAVEDIVGPMGLKTPVVYGELSTLLGQIRHKVDFNPDGSPYDFIPALFPPTPEDELETLTSGGIPLSSGPPVDAELRRLLNETSDCLDATDCALVRKLCLDRLFSQLVGSLEGPFRPSTREFDGQGSRFEDVTERTARLASLLPTVARQSQLILNDVPNEYLMAIEDVRELSEFSAIIYSSFDRDNLLGSC